jgi:hypothetical protein
MNDFIEYWAAARLLMEGKNPYSPELMLALQSSVGWSDPRPLMMWNPPWTLSVVLPFGFFSFEFGRTLWLLVNLLIIFLCIDLSWRIYEGPKRYLWLAWVVGLGFFPSLFVLRVGQITPFVMLGVIGFLYFVRRARYGLASCSTVLISLKPHLLYLFWIVLLCWIISRKQWKTLTMVCSALVLATAIPLCFNHSVVAQFFRSSIEAPPLYWVTPTVGGFLRYVFGHGHTWLQFMPTGLCLLFFIFVYWKRHRTDWLWEQQMPILLLVSVSTAVYGWSFDLVVLIPALIQAAVITIQKGRLKIAVFAVLSFVMTNVVAYWLNFHDYGELYYVWMAPVLLVSFLVISYPQEGLVKSFIDPLRPF